MKCLLKERGRTKNLPLPLSPFICISRAARSCLPFLIILLIMGFGLFWQAQAQSQYPWPVPPFDQQHVISGVFGEYRGPSNPHFHDGTDIPRPDGQSVYAVADAVVTSMEPSGSNAFVRTQDFAYVHVIPNPGLALGDSVLAGQTIIGTIVSGQGHVHFKEGPASGGVNAIRPGGGLTPYEDPWPPVVSDVRFKLQETGQRLTADALTGRVEITFLVEEINGPPGSTSAGSNNGAYIVGYSVLSRDRQTLIHLPGDEGVQFRFDTLPSNTSVHFVFDADQASTSRHVYRVTNQLTRLDAWDTSQVPPGDYTVQVFAEDTRDNRTSAFVDVTVTDIDISPPPVPTLLALTDGAAAWTGGEAPDLAGFRLYSSSDLSNWTPVLTEADLPGTVQTATLPVPDAAGAYYYLATADSTIPPNVSGPSDMYGAFDFGGPRVLVVEGFDRHGGSGSWSEPVHAFAAHHGQALAAAAYSFDTAANEQVASGAVDLTAYEAVVWLLGDESTADETFSATEQQAVRAYLEAGGKLFVNGSEIAWDLGARGSAADQAFLNNYLKVDYAGDDAGSYTVGGIEGTLFEGLAFGYGASSSPYEEDFPDHFTPASGGTAILRYGNGRTAGMAYEGMFGAGTTPGQVAVLGLPFETINGASAREAVMERVLDLFFGQATAVETADGVPQRFVLSAAYPTPFRDVLHLDVSVPQARPVRVVVYDVLGRSVARLTDGLLSAGRHTLTWQPEGLAPGTYFIRLEGDGFTDTRTVTYLR